MYQQLGQAAPLLHRLTHADSWPCLRCEGGGGSLDAVSVEELHGDALLLSWSSADSEPDVAGNARAYVARLDCAP